MTARELEQARAGLRRKRRRGTEAAALALATCGLAAVAAVSWPPLVLPLAIGAASEVLIAGFVLLAYREQVSRLALHPDAYALPEVVRYGHRLTHTDQRARLADWIAEVIAEAPLPWSFYLPDRVALFRLELAAIAHDLSIPATRVQPASLAACRRLLTHAPESPLYNARLPADELRRTLARIRDGIESG
jgi:hypothetical protein